MIVLGIESSCDETAAAVVQDGKDVLSNAVYSQVRLHSPYGGVVPEIASRNHVVYLPRTISEALKESGVDWADIDAVAVTCGPGLASSLLVGISTATALSQKLKVDLVGVNHLHAHMYSTFLAGDSPAFEATCPFLALIVSGGHTCIVRVDRLGGYRLMGRTLDDAAGEAFDKAASLLGLEYPGGPAIEKAARTGDPAAVRFPRGRITQDYCPEGLDPELCFSFSGVKTALMYHVRKRAPLESREEISDIAASFQEAVVDVLVEAAEKALSREKVNRFVVAGGVSMNSLLRTRIVERLDNVENQVLLAPREYCADNAAMIAGLAGAGGGRIVEDRASLDANPNMEF